MGCLPALPASPTVSPISTRSRSSRVVEGADLIAISLIGFYVVFGPVRLAERGLVRSFQLTAVGLLDDVTDEGSPELSVGGGQGVG